MRVALFPLNTVLFPGGFLALRIFEARYLDMISACLRNDSRFGVVSIRAGSEVGEAADPSTVGTLAEIVNWDRSADGLLHVDVLGHEKFRVVASDVQPDQLRMAQISVLPPEPAHPLPPGFRYMADLVRDLLPDVNPLYAARELRDEDAVWVSGRMTELLPLTAGRKQALLELDDPLARLGELDRELRRLRSAK